MAGRPNPALGGCTLLPRLFVYHPAVARWESFVWPRWLPVQARLPLIAQITGAFALIAALAMPQWSEIPVVTDDGPRPVAPLVSPTPPLTPLPTPAAMRAPALPQRPAHLNLDIRHRFADADLSVTVDDARVLETKLAGGGKKFGVFGKRGERGFTRTLDVAAGARVVRVRIRSAADKFDQTRVERFDLGPASVATLRVTAEKSGLSIVAERPPAPRPVPAAGPAPAAAVAPTDPPPAQPVRQAAIQASALSELYQSLRSVLIALAGFIASAATGFLVQEFLRSRKPAMFPDEAVAPKRRRAGFAS